MSRTAPPGRAAERLRADRLRRRAVERILPQPVGLAASLNGTATSLRSVGSAS